MTSLPVSRYQVGIVCALPKEMAAMAAMLDEEHKQLGTKDVHDHNSYMLGRIHQHNVVIACLPAGVYGTNAAAKVAKDMLRTFSAIRIGVLVGIGGGIPDVLNKVDIRLGDVVVSQPDKTHGGVVQYDLGKQMSNINFERKGLSDRPPAVVLTALSTLQARNQFYDSPIPTYMKDATRKHPILEERGFTFPGIERDRLRCVQCDLSKWWWPLWVILISLCTFWRCKLCKDGYVLRESRVQKTPVVHYGTIASANVLVKDVLLRDRLRDDLEAKCVEMEAAGLMNDFRCIVVRGICDYADSFKNDEWQEYAALSAAAFAKELLSHMIPEEVTYEEPLSKVLGLIKEQVDHANKHLEETTREHRRVEIRYRNDQQRRCHQMFKTSPYEGFKNMNPDRAPNTCQWVLKNPIFRQWYESREEGLLWISADPGCGKSVLAKSLVDNELQRQNDRRILYFFFKDNEGQNQLATALSAILHQLFSYEPRLIRHAMMAWVENDCDLNTEVDEMWRILLKATSDREAPSITCVFDALDECLDADRGILIRKLNRFYQNAFSTASHVPLIVRPGRLRFLVTSRPYDNIRSEFHMPAHLPSIRLRGEEENEQINKEINTVIKIRVSEIANKLGLHDTVRSQIEVRLLQMEHRTYLWLHLATESIYETFRDSFRPDQESIDCLPATIEDAYESILSKVKKENLARVRLIFKIILGAQRPLTIGEMAVALGIATTSRIDKLSNMTLNRTHLGDKIRQICGLFVVIHNSRVDLIHQTAKQFLIWESDTPTTQDTWRHSLKLSEIESLMARTCIEFLSLKELTKVGQGLAARKPGLDRLESFQTEDGPSLEDDIESFALYAVNNWAHHFRASCTETKSSLMAKVQNLYDTTSDLFKWWFPIFWSVSQPHYEWSDMNSFCLAACNGHDDVIRMYLENNPELVHRASCNALNALTWASRFNRENVVELLLEKGAAINAQKGHGNALQRASAEGHLQMVRLLLSKGADVNAQGPYSSALQRASAEGHHLVVEALLDAGAKINAREGWYGSALQAASARGHQVVVELLLSRGARVNIRGGNHFSAKPLSLAMEAGHDDIVNLLAKQDSTNVHRKDKSGFGTLTMTTSEGDMSQLI